MGKHLYVSHYTAVTNAYKNNSSLYIHSLKSGYVVGRKIPERFQSNFVNSD